MKKFTMLFVCLVILGLQMVNAQQRTITGTVTSSEDGTSIPGVSVAVKGTTVGTITNIDGKYSLGVPENSQTLVFSFVGMKTKEVVIGSTNVIDVVMEAEVIGVDEVVVTALGIKRIEKSIGYATQTVKGEELNKAPEANLVNSLSGRIAGVQITNSSGAVGSSSRMILRGSSSIYGDNQPLFIVDGIPMSNRNEGTAGGSGGFDVPNGIADINPNDIESMNVLKGPNASALYGIRAANGVVVITTKTGKRGKTLGVELNTSVTFERPLTLPDFQNSYGQGPDKDFFDYGNGTSLGGGVDESWGPPLDKGLEFMQFTSYINNPNNPQPEPWVSHPDNVKNFYETGVTSKTDVSMSGGSENTTYRLGMGYTDQKGMIPFTDFQKASVTGSGSHDFTDKFSSNFNVNYIKSWSDNIPAGGYDGSNVTQQTIWAGRQVDFEALKDYENIPLALPGSTYGAGSIPINWNTRFHNNPYWQLATNTNSFSKDRVMGNLGLNYDFTDWISLSGAISIDEYKSLTSAKLAKGAAADAPTSALYGGNRTGVDGYYDERHRTFSEINSNFMLSVQREFGSDIKTSFNFGGNSMRMTRTTNFTGIQLELDGVFNLLNVKAGTTPLNKNDHFEEAINSLYGTGEVSFRDYLFLNVTGRNDWASVLPVDNNSFFYPSVTLSAVVSDMVDLNLPFLDYVKVNGGWAKVGSSGPLIAGDVIPVYELSALPWSGNTFGQFPTTLKNSKIKPQTTNSIEGGIEMKMFKNKLRFDLTLYDMTTTDLILPVQVSRSSGVLRVWDNVGELRNKGVELHLGATVYENRAQDFSVDLDVNFARNNNEVIKAGSDDENDEESLILGGQWNMTLEAREGYPYGVIVGTSLLRNDAGEVVYKDGLPQQGENEVLGDINADWTGGVSLGINYKNFSFTTLVDAKIGGEVYSMTNAWGQYAGILEETMYGRETGVVGEGVKNIGTDSDPVYVKNDVVVPAETFNKTTYGDGIVETSVFDASYVKLRQLTLGYNLPKQWFEGTGISGLNVSVVARNVAILFRNAPHIDPETGFSSENAEQGQEFGQLASARSIGFSLNLKF
ncbi:MAG: SusC/RagA family TonB-linked outer membrane protein [Salinivirgaceae bacterium]|nr:SusC/RagA family TonB-linked outer membrane protein [Salinivirgaceae bacterium]